VLTRREGIVGTPHHFHVPQGDQDVCFRDDDERTSESTLTQSNLDLKHYL
jgi:hypothetical protein